MIIKNLAGKEVVSGIDEAIKDTTAPSAPEIVAKTISSIEVTPSDDAKEMIVTYGHENGDEKVVKITKSDDGNWTLDSDTELPDGVTIDGKIGKVTLSLDSTIIDYSVTAENSDEAGNSIAITMITIQDIGMLIPSKLEDSVLIDDAVTVNELFGVEYIDLVDNSTNVFNGSQLGDFALSESNESTIDYQGNTHIYDVYTLYSDTSIAVI